MLPLTPAQRIIAHQQWGRRMWRIALYGLGAFFAYLIVLAFFTPSLKQLEDPRYNLASEVIGYNGEVIGRYFAENRVPVTYDKLSKHLVRALIATEDERYMEHSGIDVRALGRVVKGLVTLNPQGGGSTITQQLAKLLYSDRDFGSMGSVRKVFALANRKFSEWITAVKLERSYTKEEILAMYLNKADWVNNAFGIRAASETYFSCAPDSLKLHEAALLVGMLQNPALYNPNKRPEKALKRRNIVFGQMERNGFITASERGKVSKKPLGLRFKPQSYSEGMAPYFRAELVKDVQAILKKGDLTKSDGANYDIYRDGLKIYTTIDPEMQKLAELAMREHMTELQKRYFSVWKGRDPWAYRDAETTAEQLESRKRDLNNRIRETDRYERLRSTNLEKVLSSIKKANGFDLNDAAIERMFLEDNKNGHITKLMSTGVITTEQATTYRTIMRGEYWPELRRMWVKLQAITKKEFDTPVKMRIFSWEDPSLEKEMVMSPLDSIRYLMMHMQLGSIAVDPITGHVKAWVGGISHKYFKYDHVTSDRQVGSTFKPFVYATAIAMQGISPCQKVADVAQTIRTGEGDFHLSSAWTPKNAGGYSGSSLTLFDGLKESRNTVSVYLLKQLGSTRPVRALIGEMGIDSAKVTTQPSLCLGACELSVEEMAGAYTTFANNGTFVKPLYLLRIEDKNGKLLYQAMPEEKQALQPKANYVMVQMLKYANAGASGMAGIKSQMGGKTGTTNDYVDGWFMGITPKLVIGTWVGGDKNWIRFLSIGDGQGGKMARPFFSKLLLKIEASGKTSYDANSQFQIPVGDIGIETNCANYRAEAQGIPNDGSEFGGQSFDDDADSSKPKKARDPNSFGDEL